MEEKEFRYGDIKNKIYHIVIELENAGFEREANAISCLTHIIASRIEPPNLSSKFGVEYLLQCLEDHNYLISYIDENYIEQERLRE
ncbi:hypothetical protein [Spirosoma aerophilum]